GDTRRPLSTAAPPAAPPPRDYSTDGVARGGVRWQFALSHSARSSTSCHPARGRAYAYTARRMRRSRYDHVPDTARYRLAASGTTATAMSTANGAQLSAPRGFMRAAPGSAAASSPTGGA